MTTIKSVTTVNTTAGWGARVRLADGTELFSVAPEHRYSAAEASVLAESIRRDVAHHGIEARNDLVPLPAGVQVVVPRRAYAVYERDESGAITRTGRVLKLAPADAAEYAHTERLVGWPETTVLWRAVSGPSVGVAR